MSNTMTVRIPSELENEIDKIISKEKISKSDIVRNALQRYISIKKFRQIRKKILPFAEAQGILTDEDVFKLLK